MLNSFVGKAGRPRYQLFRSKELFCFRLVSHNGIPLVTKSYTSNADRKRRLAAFRKAATTDVVEDLDLILR